MKATRFAFAVGLVLFSTLLLAAADDDCVPFDPRVNMLSEPLGLDDPAPRLSWKIRSAERGARQTAFQVLVATSHEVLGRDRGDLWDSGRISAEDNLRIAYAGAPLQSSQQVWWKVRVWDKSGRASHWSPVGTWTAGILDVGDWSPATRWITDPGLLKWQRSKLGYRSQRTKDELQPKWLQLDLGATMPIEAVRVRAVAHTVDERIGFPRRYQLEVADSPDFSDGRLVVPAAETDFNPWIGTVELPLKGVAARYVRFTATKLRVLHGEACLAISQIEVQSGGRNVAPEARVSASDTLEDEHWSLDAVIDGLGVPGVNPRASDTLRLRRTFTVRPGLKRALLHASGLGHATLAVNGAAVDAGMLTPGWTDTRKTCLYTTTDLTNRLAAGDNAIGFTLAGGMYNVQSGAKRYVKLISAFRPMTLFAELRLEYADGTVETISSDERWHVQPGPTTYANMYGGEDYDARQERADWSKAGFDATSWTQAVSTQGPRGVLRGAAWSSPPFATHETFEPKAVKQIRPGLVVFDFGQNAAMMPRLRVHGVAGTTVRMTPAELQKKDGTISRSSVGGGAAYWQYTLRGDSAGETWFPSFYYHGARYLQVELSAPEGAPLPTIDTLQSVVVHSASPAAGSFACSSDLFNRIHALVRWAQRSNFAHVLTDCPHRERLGWLEQYHLNGPSLRYEWDLGRLFSKGFNDMVDAQRANGHIPSLVPEYVIFDGGFVDSPEWASALILAGWQHYLFTGDDAPLRMHYAAMQRYFDYLTSRADNHILSHGLGDWYDQGPARPGNVQLTPVALTATAIYYEDARVLSLIATHLQRPEDARKYDAMADKIGAAFNAKFFDEATGVYATGSQTSQAMPLVLGLVPEHRRGDVLAVLLRDIEARNHAVTAGDVGYRYLLRALADAGRSDVIFAMNNQSERPGYGYQLDRGATSLTEAWNTEPNSSQNHFMLGQVMEWFYQDLAGIAVDPAKPGFKNVIIRPQPVGDLTWAAAKHQAPQGEISVRWDRKDGRFRLRLTIPPNSTATVSIPASAEAGVTEGGKPARQSPGVKFLRTDADRQVYTVGAGTYDFETGS